MPEEPKPVPDPSTLPVPPPAVDRKPDPAEEDVGDFITRNVLEKDSVFFEG